MSIYLLHLANGLSLITILYFSHTFLDDLWMLDVIILFKRIGLVEILIGAIRWTVWLERNRICFQQGTLDPMNLILSI
jgi:hypothetical protein